MERKRILTVDEVQIYLQLTHAFQKILGGEAEQSTALPKSYRTNCFICAPLDGGKSRNHFPGERLRDDSNQAEQQEVLDYTQKGSMSSVPNCLY